MRILRLVAGALLGVVAVALLWGLGIVQPPESVSRRIAVFAAAYPGHVAAAEAERISCPPLARLRFYVVCTEGCEGVWRIVGVRGLDAENLANLNRLPPESSDEVRLRTNEAIARERLRLDAEGARQMIGCYLRLEGLRPELLLREADREAVERARASGEEAMASVAEALDDPEALARVAVAPAADGFAARACYWDTEREGRPVLDLAWTLARDGRILAFEAREAPVRGGTASGNSPGTPPT